MVKYSLLEQWQWSFMAISFCHPLFPTFSLTLLFAIPFAFQSTLVFTIQRCDIFTFFKQRDRVFIIAANAINRSYALCIRVLVYMWLYSVTKTNLSCALLNVFSLFFRWQTALNHVSLLLFATFFVVVAVIFSLLLLLSKIFSVFFCVHSSCYNQVYVVPLIVTIDKRRPLSLLYSTYTYTDFMEMKYTTDNYLSWNNFLLFFVLIWVKLIKQKNKLNIEIARGGEETRRLSEKKSSHSINRSKCALEWHYFVLRKNNGIVYKFKLEWENNIFNFICALVHTALHYSRQL